MLYVKTDTGKQRSVSTERRSISTGASVIGKGEETRKSFGGGEGKMARWIPSHPAVTEENHCRV